MGKWSITTRLATAGEIVRAVVFTLIMVVMVWMDHALGNDNAHLIRQDPFSSTIITTLIISAVATAASVGASYLTSYFGPKPKPIDKGKLQGDLLLQNVGENLFINEFAGAPPVSDGIGGSRSAGIIMYMSAIRHVVEVVSGSGGGRGGKGGGPKPQDERRHRYFCDFAILCANKGPYGLLQLKANTDTLYDRTGHVINPSAAFYEAEDGTLGGTASVVTDSECSGGEKVHLSDGDTVSFAVTVLAAGDYLVSVYYKSGTANSSVEVSANGGTPEPADLYAGQGEDVLSAATVTLTLTSGANTILVECTDADGCDIDRLYVFLAPLVPGEDWDGTTGIEDERVVYAEPLNNDLPPDPETRDYTPILQYSAVALPDETGMLELTTKNGGQIRFYEGNATQLQDPFLEGVINAQYQSDGGISGRNYTPGFRHRAYFIAENFELTDYRSMPNWTFVLAHKELKTVEEFIVARSARAGVESSDIDMSEFAELELRGWAVTQRQPPKTDMELLARVHDVDFLEDTDGVIRGVIPSDEIEVIIPDEELDCREGIEKTDEPRKLVDTRVRDDLQIPRSLDIGYINADNKLEIGNARWQREVTGSQKHEQAELPITMREDEAQRFVLRDLQKQWAEKDGLEVRTFPKYLGLNPTALIGVEEEDGSITRMRVKSMEGGTPGALKLSGVSRRLFEIAQPVDSDRVPLVSRVLVPANTIGTLIDIPRLLSQNNTSGFYAACCSRDSLSGVWGGATLWRRREAGWEPVDNFTAQSTLGRATSVLADEPAGLEEGREDFITLTFQNVLSRDPSADELAYWLGQLDILGASIESISTLLHALFEGPEYAALATDDTQFVTDVYWGYFNRAPGAGGDTDGLDYWVAQTAIQGRPAILLAQDDSQEFADRVAVALSTAFDTTSSITVDLFYGEFETLTDAQVLDGANAIVAGNEVIGFATAARVSGYANRWTLTRLLRGLKGTGSAPSTHVAGERVVLLNTAVRFVPIDIREKNVSRIFAFVTSGQALEKAGTFTFTWTGQTAPGLPVYQTIDTDVPTVTTAPTVTKMDGQNAWVVYTPKPDANFISPNQLEIRVRTTADVLVRTLPGDMSSGRTMVPMTSADAWIDYRYQNLYRGGTPPSDGWSDYSPYVVAAGTTTGTTPNDSGLTDFDIDPNDVGGPGTREFTYV